MARKQILGGMAGTQLQAGKPFFKRIVRIGGNGGYLREDGMTCEVVTQAMIDDVQLDFVQSDLGKINFRDAFSPDWNAGAEGNEGELIMVELPTTNRVTEIQIEEAWKEGNLLTRAEEPAVRCKVAFLAEGQDVSFDKDTGTFAQPIANLNFIELSTTEGAKIDSRTKAFFILVQKYESGTTPTSFVLNGSGLTTGAPGDALDAISILITSILDHEPNPGEGY